MEENKKVEPVQSILNAGLTITNARIEASHDITISGTFKGKIKSTAKVTVSEGATFDGCVKCQSFESYGSFKGKMKVKGTAEFHCGSYIDGAIEVGTLAADTGAILRAEIKVIDKPSSKPAPKVAPAAAPSPALAQK